MKSPTHLPRFLFIIWLLTVGVLLSACGGAPGVRPEEVPETSTVPIGADNRDITASRLPESGSLADAAQLLEQASIAEGTEKQTLLVQASQILLDNSQYNQAQQIYQQIDKTLLDADVSARYQLIGAKLALLTNNPGQARTTLNRLLSSETQDPDILGYALELLAESDSQQRHFADALDHFVEAESYQSDDAAIQNIRYRIARLLESLDNQQLETINQQAHNVTSRAWAELALIYRKLSAEPDQLDLNLQTWRQQHPDHTGEQYLSGQFPGGKPARQVALLLPLSSKFANAANAVRSGFLHMQAADTSPQAPLVKVYDIGAIPELATEVYEQAVNEGADFVVGPLGKAAVQQLFDTARFTVPTLLLGDASGIPSETTVYQLSLSPEQEAAQLAQHAWLENKRTAVVLYPEGQWGQRVFTAFQSQWNQLGGTSLGNASYASDQADYSPVIKQLLGIQLSEARKAKLTRLLGVSLKFKPRRREDIDTVVLFANPSKGRLIKPQIDFYAGLKMPVYSISRIYSGKRNKVRDADLNRLAFGDMPWILAGNNQVADIQKRIQDSGNSPNNTSRLYALGVDAYQLTPWLAAAGVTTSVELQGVTGRLQLKPDGRFQRWLTWARFENGEPRIIDSFFGDDDSNDSAE